MSCLLREAAFFIRANNIPPRYVFASNPVEMKTLLTFSVLTLTAVLQTACHSNSTDCSKTMCTADFRMITVELKDSLGNAYIPDKVQTFFNGSLLQESNTPPVPMQNVYTVADDSHLLQLQLNVNRDLVFKVIKNNLVVKEASFVAKADCCHVSKVSGPAEISIP